MRSNHREAIACICGTAFVVARLRAAAVPRLSCPVDARDKLGRAVERSVVHTMLLRGFARGCDNRYSRLPTGGEVLEPTVAHGGVGCARQPPWSHPGHRPSGAGCSVRPSGPRFADLTAQHRDFVAQDEDLDILEAAA